MPHTVTVYDYATTERSHRLWTVVENHRPQSESYALKYGSLILAVPTVITSFMTQKYFNRCFKIKGRVLFTYTPMFVPAIASGLLHRKLIEEDVLQENIRCAGCTEFKAGGIHLLSGVLWSFLLSSFTSCMVGSLRKTVYVPPLEKYPLETLKLVGKHCYRFAPTGLVMCLGNFAFVLAFTNLEIKQYINIKLRMLARLNYFDSEVTPAEFGEDPSQLF